MADSWSKEDRFHYKKSEVWQELEQIVLDTVRRADILQQKIAAQGEMPIPSDDDMSKLREAVELTNQLVGDANDEVAGEALVEDSVLDNEADDDEASDELQNEVIDDLSRLVMAALEEGNIKLAYKIERTIDEILEQDVACE